jgi:uncharacterized protein YndB with AHSA1/START domain/DNA-binding MarR family transcriptional regulator
MLYYDNMDKFTALADPTRRKIIEMLARRGTLSAREICEQFPVSPPAISQHLKILREANWVLVEKRAQQRIYQINPEAIRDLESWAGELAQLWNQRFDVLDQILAVEKKKSRTNPIERISAMENQKIKELTLTRVFDAPRELVFKAWTDPKLVAQWWSPNGFTNPVCELDARPDGSILIHMRGPDGVEYPMQGVYHEVVPPERLVFTTRAVADAAGSFQLEVHNTVTFAELGGKTQLTLHAVVIKATSAAAGALAGMEAGWSQSLDKLAGILG